VGSPSHDIAAGPTRKKAVRVVKPTDEQLNSWMDRFNEVLSEFTSKLDEQLSNRDRRAAESFAVAVASHVGEGGPPDLGAVPHNGATKRNFERGRRAFSESFPGDPFEVVRQIGLVDSYLSFGDPSARQVFKVSWKRMFNTRQPG
jgi:hypothetical protein